MPIPDPGDDMSRALRFLVGWGERLKDEGPLTRDEACRIAVAWRRDAAGNGIAEDMLVAAAGRPLPEHLLAMFGERHGPRADPVPAGGSTLGGYVRCAIRPRHPARRRHRPHACRGCRHLPSPPPLPQARS